MEIKNCNQLRAGDAGQPARLRGWIDSIRDHGGILFIDLRDRKGRTQIVFDPENESLASQFGSLKPESVIEITGETLKRSDETINASLDTGEIEVHAATLIIHNVSDTPPFPMDETADKVRIGCVQVMCILVKKT